MRKLNIHRVWLAILMANLAMALFAIESWCRLKSPPSLVDVRDLAEKAPLVFRGHVLTITRNADNRLSLNEFVGLAKPGARVPSIAKIQVDRWYRGKGSNRSVAALCVLRRTLCRRTRLHRFPSRNVLDSVRRPEGRTDGDG